VISQGLSSHPGLVDFRRKEGRTGEGVGVEGEDVVGANAGQQIFIFKTNVTR